MPQETPGEADRAARPALVAKLRALRRPRERRAAGVCLAEGPHLVGEALAAGLRPVAAFATRRWSDGAEGRDLAALLAEALSAPGLVRRPEMPSGWHLVTERDFQRLSGTVTPQGVLGVFQTPDGGGDGPGWTLVLDGVQDPGNVGALARALLAFGGPASLLLTGEATADPFGEKALRASAGAMFRLRHRHADEGLPAALRALCAAGSRVWVLCPRGGVALPQAALEAPAALVVGSEGSGASEAVLEMGRALTVPMPGPAESLNAALAGAIVLYEAAVRSRRA